METIITMMLMMMVLIIIPPAQQQSHRLPLSAPCMDKIFSLNYFVPYLSHFLKISKLVLRLPFIYEYLPIATKVEMCTREVEIF